jgi:hypothetical protein
VVSLGTSNSTTSVLQTDNSLRYLFPDAGLFEIIARISSQDVRALAAFDVIVQKKKFIVWYDMFEMEHALSSVCNE